MQQLSGRAGQHGTLHGLRAELVSEILRSDLGVAERQPGAASSPPTDGIEEVTDDRLGGVALLSQLLHVLLFDVLVGLGAVGEVHRLDGAQRDQPASRCNGAGSDLAGRWSPLWNDGRGDRCVPCRPAVSAVFLDGLLGWPRRTVTKELDSATRGIRKEDPCPRTRTGDDAGAARVYRACP